MMWPVDGPFVRGDLLPLRGTDRYSAIEKQRAGAPVWLGHDGLDGDRVADRRFHGGPDRSLCHYPAEHYSHWRRYFRHLQRIAPASFGENLSTQGLDEAHVCIGDRFALGEAIIEVSQPRSPCIKLDRHHDTRGLSRQLGHSGRTGWLYRTLEPGLVEPGALLRLLDRPFPGASVLRVWRGFHDQNSSEAELSELMQIPALASEYRRHFGQRLDTQRREQDQGTLF